MEFNGDHRDLEKIILNMDRTIVYSVTKENMHQIKTGHGEVINLLNSGKLFIQGTPAIKERFKFDFHHHNHYLSKDPSQPVLK